jgi:coenzyme PQQ precursor peptide PqqA
LRFDVIYDRDYLRWQIQTGLAARWLQQPLKEEIAMKTWMKPSVREQEVGLEVTSYLPAEIDVI